MSDAASRPATASGGVPVHTVSLQGLLLTQQSTRPQDIQDAIVPRRAIDAGA